MRRSGMRRFALTPDVDRHVLGARHVVIVVATDLPPRVNGTLAAPSHKQSVKTQAGHRWAATMDA